MTMTILAKFATTCNCCNKRINVGDAVVWSKGSKAKHAACADRGEAMLAAKQPERVTVCGCCGVALNAFQIQNRYKHCSADCARGIKPE